MKIRLHRAWVRSNNANKHKAAYTKVRNKVKKLIRRAKRQFEKDIARKTASSPKFFWSHVRSKLKSRESVAPLYDRPDDKDSIEHSDLEKANILQRQFSSVFTIEPEGELPEFNSIHSSIYITAEMVAKKFNYMGFFLDFLRFKIFNGLLIV